MRIRPLLFAMSLVLTACGSEKKAEPAAAGSDTPPSSTDPKPTAPTGRPASITPEMNETFELYVVAFEKLSSDLGAAAPDCAKAVAVVEQHSKALDALDARGEALRAQMAKLREAKDEAAITWFAETYAPRMKGAVGKMGPLVASCEKDPAVKSAMTALMARYPMMRKKQ